MKQSHLPRRVILAGVIAFGIGGRAWGTQVNGAPPADSHLSIARYYTSSVVNVGVFPGKLVRLSCDSNANSKAQGDHDYALALEDDEVIHPLLPGTNEVQRELSSAGLQGADVAVHGKYYPSTGAIFVSRVAVRTPGAMHEDLASKYRARGWWSGDLLDLASDGPRLARCVSH